MSLLFIFRTKKVRRMTGLVIVCYCIASTVGRLVADWTSEQSTGRVMAHGRSDDIDILDKKKEERL
jgi:prolipoprotein diacylglyceryltransferase